MQEKEVRRKVEEETHRDMLCQPPALPGMPSHTWGMLWGSVQRGSRGAWQGEGLSAGPAHPWPCPMPWGGVAEIPGVFRHGIGKSDAAPRHHVRGRKRWWRVFPAPGAKQNSLPCHLPVPACTTGSAWSRRGAGCWAQHGQWLCQATVGFTSLCLSKGHGQQSQPFPFHKGGVGAVAAGKESSQRSQPQHPHLEQPQVSAPWL